MQWLMLQQEAPEDFVIATGEQHSVREVIECAGRYLDMDICWEGEGKAEKGVDRRTGEVVVEVDPAYFRPTEVETLLGDATKARRKLGWTPRISFEELIAEMVASDLNEARRDHLCLQEGYQTFNQFD
jgi:GDPmannose 4,6-dehydratase